MPDILWILHVSLLILAFFSSLLVSLPNSTNPDCSITHSHFNESVQLNGKNIQNLMLGTLAPCSSNDCSKAAIGYVVHLSSAVGNQTATIPSKLTRTLVVHLALISAIVLTFILSIVVSRVLYRSPRMNWFNLTVSCFAPILALIAQVIDITFFVSVRSELRDLKVAVNTKPGPGFWMLLACLILLAGTPFIVWWRLPVPPPNRKSEWKHSVHGVRNMPSMQIEGAYR